MKLPRITLALAITLFAYVLAVNAWVCDDAYITLRTVDNVLTGHGLTWNPVERVQAYTHPLWLLLLVPVYAVVGDAYWSVLSLSFALCLATALLVARLAGREREGAVAGLLLLLVSSKAFVDYGTSGLENPLSYFLLAAFYGPLLLGDRAPEARSGRAFVGLVLAASLATLNRSDTLLLYLPALVHLAYARRRRGLRELALLLAVGFAPLLAWEVFSLVYYGFALPNTYYAKLNTGLPATALLRQGVAYLENSFRWDPPTLWLCAASVALAASRRGLRRMASTGVVLYLAYVVWVGGDFMSGRFLAGPYFLASLIVLPDLVSRRARGLAVATAVVVAVGSAQAPVRSTRSYPNLKIDARGVGDERGHYFKTAGLLFFNGGVYPDHEWMRAGIRYRSEQGNVRFRKNTGYFGFAAGPEKTLIDPYALSDPLLARLPMDPAANWRIGHFVRTAPEGYEESFLTGENRIVDPDLRVYYDKLRLVVAGPVFSSERLTTVIAMNLGRYDAYRNRYVARRPSAARACP